jgi:hypothetical protein
MGAVTLSVQRRISLTSTQKGWIDGRQIDTDGPFSHIIWTKWTI